MAFSITHTIHAYHIDLEFYRKNEQQIHRIQANELINANNHEHETNTRRKKNTNNWRERKNVRKYRLCNICLVLGVSHMPCIMICYINFLLADRRTNE